MNRVAMMPQILAHHWRKPCPEVNIAERHINILFSFMRRRNCREKPRHAGCQPYRRFF
ncbi:hypothetical protein [Fontimonas thermophila]|uniref:hypothetical protein n=1 Tax=Fontimonas thermophila TaxID=1076937 RepID=UPI001F244742|nr:hypothetical protein [Fontimonas thermophila]